MFRNHCGTVVGLTCLLLSACQTFSPDGGMDLVASIAGSELNKDVAALRTPDEAEAAHVHVRALLRRPLTADAAVQIALLNNRGLQAAYNELGIAEAVMVEASLPPSPTIALSAISTPVELDIERRIIGDILALATLEARTEIARDRFRQAQLGAALETLRLATKVRRAYFRAVAARQLTDFLTQGVSAAETTAELAKRLSESGSMNKLDQTRDQAFYAEMTAQLGTARQRADSERERLVRTLGVWGSDLSFRLPNTLPALPQRLCSLRAIESEAVRRRVDLQIARIEVDALAKSYRLTSVTRFINLADVSAVSRTQRESGGTHGTGGGGEIELQVPIFDFGEARVHQAGEAYLEAVNRLAENAVNVRSQAREAYHVHRASYDIAKHYRDRVLPLRKVISDEMALRYGAMQIDVFSLLTEARQRIAANIAAIEAQRDYWLADANLTAALVGGEPALSETDSQPMGGSLAGSRPEQ
jgi:outer membrane protein TolC